MLVPRAKDNDAPDDVNSAGQNSALAANNAPASPISASSARVTTRSRRVSTRTTRVRGTPARTPNTPARTPDTPASTPNTPASMPDVSNSVPDPTISVPDTPSSVPSTLLTTILTAVSATSISQNGSTIVENITALATQTILVDANSATTLTSPAETNTSGTGKSTNVSDGAIAGIAIGTFLFGALLVAIIPLLLRCWNKRKTSHSRRFASEKYLADSRLNGEDATSDQNTTAIIDANLPQPVEDKTLRDEFSKIAERISGHVQSYYVLDGGIDTRAVAHIISQAIDSDPPEEDITKLLSTVKGRASVLRYATARVMTSRMILESRESLLPAAVTLFAQTMPPLNIEDSGEYFRRARGEKALNIFSSSRAFQPMADH
jgi:hypothetical protein